MIMKAVARTMIFHNQRAAFSVNEAAEKGAYIINGEAIANEIKMKIKENIRDLAKQNPRIHRRPCLGYIMVGKDPRTDLYVNLKKRACEEIGMEHMGIGIPVDATQEEVIDRIKEFNTDERISGILVQLPLPKSCSVQKVFNHINPDKDVDGICPANVVDLVMKENHPRFIPCSAKGCLYLISKYFPFVEKKRCVVLGQSMLVGAPLAYSLQNMEATVTMCNALTPNLPSITREGDILVVDINKPKFVKADWIKPGALVIDVGINTIDEPSRPSGFRVVGDVDFSEAKKVAGYITPVPKGIGPITIAMLMQNLFIAWKRHNFSLHYN